MNHVVKGWVMGEIEVYPNAGSAAGHSTANNSRGKLQ